MLEVAWHMPVQESAGEKGAASACFELGTKLPLELRNRKMDSPSYLFDETEEGRWSLSQRIRKTTSGLPLTGHFLHVLLIRLCYQLTAGSRHPLHVN